MSHMKKDAAKRNSMRTVGSVSTKLATILEASMSLADTGVTWKRRKMLAPGIELVRRSVPETAHDGKGN